MCDATQRPPRSNSHRTRSALRRVALRRVSSRHVSRLIIIATIQPNNKRLFDYTTHIFFNHHHHHHRHHHQNNGDTDTDTAPPPFFTLSSSICFYTLVSTSIRNIPRSTAKINQQHLFGYFAVIWLRNPPPTTFTNIPHPTYFICRLRLMRLIYYNLPPPSALLIIDLLLVFLLLQLSSYHFISLSVLAMGGRRSIYYICETIRPSPLSS